MTQSTFWDVPMAEQSLTPVQKELKRLGASAEKVRQRLKAGPATNVQLNDICFRYGARMWELKQRGAEISKEHVADGVYRYALLKDIEP